MGIGPQRLINQLARTLMLSGAVPCETMNTWRRFRNGRQEDAHEYLLCLLDHLHEAHRRVVKGVSSSKTTCGPQSASSDSRVEDQANSFVHSIFGGRSRSQIECMGFEYESSLFEPFLDLSLQIFRRVFVSSSRMSILLTVEPYLCQNAAVCHAPKSSTAFLHMGDAGLSYTLSLVQ